MGETPHSMVLQSLQMELGIRAKAWNIRALPMHRVEAGEGRSHIADICVVTRDQPLRDVLQMPPLLCVEIVSPEDGLSDTNEKVEQYIDAGVRVVWVVDPRRRKAYQTVNGTSTMSVTQLTVPGTDILVYAEELFSELDEFEVGDWQRSTLN